MTNPVEAIFGPPSARRALVVAGACGNVGAGKLGQFARLLAPHQVPVVALDLLEGVHELPARLAKELAGKFDAATVDRVLSFVTTVRGDASAVDRPIGMVFEAIPERLDWKQAFYRKVREVAPEAYVFSATSGFTTRKLFGGLPGAERCGVLHPFFPHLTNKLFEHPTDGVTSPATTARVRDLWTRLGLVLLPVRDVASFAADRVFCLMMSEAVRLHADTGLPPSVIDAALADLLGARPFLVHNLIAGSNRLSVSCVDELAGESASSFYQVAELWRGYAADPTRRWGMDERRPAAPAERDLVRERVLGGLLAVASRIVDEKIASPRDLNFLCEEALAFRKGLVALARELGLDRARELVLRFLERRAVTRPDEVAAPSVFSAARERELAGLYVTTRLEGDCLAIELGRASINEVYVRELAAALDELARGPARSAVLVPDGVYCQEFGRGADVSEFLPALGDETKARELSARWKAVVARLRASAKPVVAALARRSLGGSNEIAALCHARIAAPGTSIGQPEPVVGVVPGLGGTTTLLRSVPPPSRPRVAELLLTGDPVDAEEARRLGFVQEVVPSEALRGRAIDLARALATGEAAPPAFERGPYPISIPAVPLANAAGVALDREHRALLEETIRGCAERSYEEAMEYETAQSGKAFLLPAARIGTKALLSGKQPEFPRG